MPAQLTELFKTFRSDERGAIALIVSLMFFGLVFAAGVAIDLGRIEHVRTRLAGAADAAALAAGKALLSGGASDAEVTQIALDYLNANVPPGALLGVLGTPDITINRAEGSVTISAEANLPMTLMKVAGYDSVDVPIYSATQFEMRDIELGMALDVTGSMGGQKIADLKLAAKDLIDILMPDGGTPHKVRIGLAPYARAINAGTYAGAVTDGISTDCVHERGGSQAFTDAAPIGVDALGYTGGMTCPSAKIEPLSEDKSDLKSQIDAYQAGGYTAGHLGAAWAWYLVSPNWNSIWPAASEPVAYSEPETTKAVLLMTDGVFNKYYVGSNGNSATQAREVCAEMKDEGVVVYSVAFQAPSDAAALLAECATSGDHYFNAANGEELRLAFVSIASQLNKLRLTN